MDAQINLEQRIIQRALAVIFLAILFFPIHASEMKDIAIYKDWRVTKVVNNMDDNVEYRAISNVTRSREAYFLTCEHSFIMNKQMRAGHTLMVQYHGDFDRHIAEFSLMGYTAATSKLKALCSGKYLANN